MYKSNFNPRTREGCDLDAKTSTVSGSKISIHAPVKGATRMTATHRGYLGAISIHAPVKGAT